MIRLDSYTGTYTIPAATIQQIVSGLDTAAVVCRVSQVNTTQITHDGGKVSAVMQDDVHALLKVN